AMAVYAMAFVFYAVDLANRSAAGAAAEPESAAQRSTNTSAAVAGAGSDRGTVATLSRTDTQRPGSRVTKAPRSRALRIGFSLTVLGFLLHLAAALMRGIGAGRVPFSNMYEFAMTATLAIVLIFVLIQFFVDLRFL